MYYEFNKKENKTYNYDHVFNVVIINEIVVNKSAQNSKIMSNAKLCLCCSCVYAPNTGCYFAIF